MKKTVLSRRSLLASAIAFTLAGSLWQAPARADEFKMGLLVPNSIGEEGWSRIGYDALKRVEKELGAKVSHVELPENPDAFEKAFRDFAGQGFRVVLGHGFQFTDPVVYAEQPFPCQHECPGIALMFSRVAERFGVTPEFATVLAGEACRLKVFDPAVGTLPYILAIFEHGLGVSQSRPGFLRLFQPPLCRSAVG